MIIYTARYSNLFSESKIKDFKKRVQNESHFGYFRYFRLPKWAQSNSLLQIEDKKGNLYDNEAIIDKFKEKVKDSNFNLPYDNSISRDVSKYLEELGVKVKKNGKLKVRHFVEFINLMGKAAQKRQKVIWKWKKNNIVLDGAYINRLGTKGALDYLKKKLAKKTRFSFGGSRNIYFQKPEEELSENSHYGRNIKGRNALTIKCLQKLVKAETSICLGKEVSYINFGSDPKIRKYLSKFENSHSSKNTPELQAKDIRKVLNLVGISTQV